jgi:hypothetical protein
LSVAGGAKSGGAPPTHMKNPKKCIPKPFNTEVAEGTDTGIRKGGRPQKPSSPTKQEPRRRFLKKSAGRRVSACMPLQLTPGNRPD